MQVDNARVIKALQAGNLSLASLLFHRVLKFEFVIDFDSVLLLISFVQTQSYLCVSPLTDAFADLIIIKTWNHVFM